MCQDDPDLLGKVATAIDGYFEDLDQRDKIN